MTCRDINSFPVSNWSHKQKLLVGLYLSCIIAVRKTGNLNLLISSLTQDLAAKHCLCQNVGAPKILPKTDMTLKNFFFIPHLSFKEHILYMLLEPWCMQRWRITFHVLCYFLYCRGKKFNSWDFFFIQIFLFLFIDTIWCRLTFPNPAFDCPLKGSWPVPNY